MAKHDTDPVLGQLIRAVNESGQTTEVPISVSAHGTVVTGILISQDAYFTKLAEGSPLLSALQPTSELLGKEYAKEVSAGADSYVHVRAAGAEGEGLWRITLDAVDGWDLRAASGETSDGKGPFARFLGA